MSDRKEDFQTDFELPASNPTSSWDIQRAYDTRDLLVNLVSTKQVVTKNHWWKGRTGLCLKEKCPACEAHTEIRIQGYCLAVEVKDGRRLILEYTLEPAIALDNHWKRYGTLRGLGIILFRKPRRYNGKVHLKIRGTMSNQDHHPMEEDMWPTICHILGLQPNAPKQPEPFIASEDVNLPVEPTFESRIAGRRLTVPEPLPGQMSLLSGIGALPEMQNQNGHKQD